MSIICNVNVLEGRVYMTVVKYTNSKQITKTLCCVCIVLEERIHTTFVMIFADLGWVGTIESNFTLTFTLDMHLYK